jgi:hypothetical protein
MLTALGSLLPIAVAMALSSVPITATLIILLSPRRKQSSLPFLVGWVLSIGVVVMIAARSTLALRIASRGQQLAAIAIAEIVLGGALVVFAILAWHRSDHAPPTGKTFLDSLGSLGPLGAFGIGFAMGFRPKGLLLGAAAGLALANKSLTATTAGIAVGFYVTISASTVAVPIIWTLASPSRMEPRLATWHDWLNRNGRLLTASIMLMIGVVIMGAGVSDL